MFGRHVVSITDNDLIQTRIATSLAAARKLRGLCHSKKIVQATRDPRKTDRIDAELIVGAFWPEAGQSKRC